MSEQLSKDEKLVILVSTGLIDDAEKFKNLTVEQIENLTETAKKLFRKKTKEELDTILKSKEGDALLKEQLSVEVVRRRKATQSLKKYKSRLKSKLDELVGFVK